VDRPGFPVRGIGGNLKKKLLFLPKNLRRIRNFYILIWVLVMISVLILFFRIQYLDDYIKGFLTAKTEGSLSELNSFKNTLITELDRRSSKEEKEEEKKTAEEIKDILLEAARNIEKLPIPRKSIAPNNVPVDLPEDLNIDRLEHDEVKRYLDDNLLDQLTLKDLNLEMEVKNVKNGKGKILFRRTYIHNSDKYGFIPKSFLFIPTQLVNQECTDWDCLSVSIKREIVFSKLVEEELINVCENTGARQAYFVSLLGFVRVYKKDTPNPVKELKKNFSHMYKQSFADRTYVDPTIEKGFRPSNPYIDVAGMGIVKTYTVRIIHKDLRVVGILCIDRTLKPLNSLKPLIKELSLGSVIPFFKNFWVDFAKEITTDGLSKLKNLRDKEKEQIAEDYKDNQGKFFSDIQRFDSKARNATIFTVPLEGKELAFVIFDKSKLRLNMVLFVLGLAVIIGIITISIRYIYTQTLTKIKAEQKPLDLISHMHNSYVITDKKNFIIDCNDEFKKLVEEENVEGKNFLDFLTDNSAVDYQYLIDRDSERFECTLNISVKEDKRPVILINTKTEYPFVKNSRISIIIQSEKIESLVAGKYVAQISHILKTPLHSIRVIAEQLMRKESLARFDDYSRILDTEIASLSKSLTRLLKISQAELKHLKPEIEKVDLSRLVSLLVEEFAPLAKEKKLEFYCSIAPKVTIFCDSDMIKAAIENILDNALKYTLKGSISIKLIEESNENVKIDIEDTGIGIPEEDFERIFEKQYRCNHPVVQQSGGQGIGLYLCKQYINIHNGKIHVKSKLDVGTTFTVTLPKKNTI
jgi:two-component system phosphate regulon sensor histidine kinase PhoR